MSAARRRMIEERRKSSPFWTAIHWLGSLQLALVLLATIGIACAVATFAESSFDTKIAHAYIYKAPWFVLWLFVLCLNLLAVTLTRWPWQKKHTGFIVTHYGIIALLVGAMIGLHAGFEGNVTLRAGRPGSAKVTVNRTIIQLQNPSGRDFFSMPFDAGTAGLAPDRERVFDVPGTDLRVVADAFSDNLLPRRELLPSPGGGQGILLRMSSAMMGQRVDLPMALGGGTPVRESFFGLAEIALLPELPPPLASKDTETRMVFARFEPVIAAGRTPDATRVLLNEDGSAVTLQVPGQSDTTFPLEEILGQPLSAAGAIVTVEEYWPDFEMRDGKPSTKSPLPKNPAALVRIHPKTGGPGTKPTFLVAPAEGGIAYQLERGGATYASGTAKPGRSFRLGWADWQAEIVASLPCATTSTSYAPGPPLPGGRGGLPGFRARLASKSSKDSDKQWIASGEIATFTTGSQSVRVGYGLELRSLPFSVRLLSFEVPRYEGTDNPSNFISTLEFTELHTGEKKVGVARMNHPASFPGTWFANLTGLNYKFSQAGWNPRDLEETTLQVLYDPGWLLKWVGSLAICAGITTMFYFKPSS